MRRASAMVLGAALLVATVVLQPARAGLLGLMIYGPPDRYGQAFTQCAASTVTAEQELACARNYVAANPVPAVGAAEVTAFFERGRALIEAVRRGRISDAEARAQLAENMASAQSRVQGEVQERLPRHHSVWCNSFGYSTYCNGH